MQSGTRPPGFLPVLALSAALPVSCLGKQPADGVAPPSPSVRAMGSLVDPTPVYRAAGLLAHSQPLPFVGTVSYLAGRSTDSTLVVLALSLANRSLTFADDTASRLAVYTVTAAVRQGDTTIRQVEARETVRVTSYRETERVDESVVFQRYFALSPGPYVLALALRDEGSNRTATVDVAISVPRYTARALSSLIPVHTADLRDAGDSAPTFILNPRSTLVFGRDTALQVYVEGYSLGADRRVVMELLDEGAAPLWRDTVTLVERRALHAALVSVPASRLGLGRVTLVATPVGAAESVRTPLFISLGDEWAVSSFDELSSWLRYFSTPDRLRALRDTAVGHRVRAWAEFLRSTDPVPATSEHEGLRDYFARIQRANEQFRGEAPSGWLTDRGKVFIVLGEPEQILEPPSAAQGRGRQQAWVYRRFQLRLFFVDQTGFGQWRLTPSSQADFELVARRVQGH